MVSPRWTRLRRCYGGKREIFVTSFGVLFALGLVCLLIGGTMPFDMPEVSDLRGCHSGRSRCRSWRGLAPPAYLISSAV